MPTRKGRASPKKKALPSQAVGGGDGWSHLFFTAPNTVEVRPQAAQKELDDGELEVAAVYSAISAGTELKVQAGL